MSDQIISEGTGTVESEMLRDENRVTGEFYRTERPINHPKRAISRS